MTEKPTLDRDRRVELPVLCKYLRCKSGYGAVIGAGEPGRDGKMVDATDWQLGTSSTEVYSCLATMEAFGPDDSYAHATVCQSGRGCYRRE